MVQTFKSMLRDWNASQSERAKLQHIYLAAGIAGIILAGLVGLIDYDTSRAILRFSFIALGVFLANAIIWALLFSLVIAKLPQKQTPARKNDR